MTTDLILLFSTRFLRKNLRIYSYFYAKKLWELPTCLTRSEYYDVYNIIYEKNGIISDSLTNQFIHFKPNTIAKRMMATAKDLITLSANGLLTASSAPWRWTTALDVCSYVCSRL